MKKYHKKKKNDGKKNSKQVYNNDVESDSNLPSPPIRYEKSDNLDSK